MILVQQKDEYLVSWKTKYLEKQGKVKGKREIPEKKEGENVIFSPYNMLVCMTEMQGNPGGRNEMILEIGDGKKYKYLY